MSSTKTGLPLIPAITPVSASGPPEQRTRIARDLRSWEERTKDISRLFERWQQGEWTPADWGLERDPVHRQWLKDNPPDVRLAQSTEGKQPDEAPEPDDELVIAQDETRWERYVREFIARYGLDNAQRTSALNILVQLQDRAVQMRDSRADVLDVVDRLIKNADSPDKRADYVKQREDLLIPIRTLFEELKSRLENLPTSAQRRAAGGN